MFTNELIPFVEEEYRIRAKKEFRAIAGLSMGDTARWNFPNAIRTPSPRVLH